MFLEKINPKKMASAEDEASAVAVTRKRKRPRAAAKTKTKTKAKAKAKTKPKVRTTRGATTAAIVSSIPVHLTADAISALDDVLEPENWRNYVVGNVYQHYKNEFLVRLQLMKELTTDDAERERCVKLQHGLLSMRRYLARRLWIMQQVSTPFEMALYQVCQCVERIEATPVATSNNREYMITLHWNAHPFFRNHTHRIPPRMRAYCNVNNEPDERFLAHFAGAGHPPSAPVRVSNQLYQRLETWINLCSVQDAVEVHAWTWARRHRADWEIWSRKGGEKNEFGIDINTVHETFPFTHVRNRLVRYHKDLSNFLKIDLANAAKRSKKV